MNVEMVQFVDRSGVVSNKRPGKLVGTSLVVAYASFYDTEHWKIFNIWNGKPVIPHKFKKQHEAEAIKVAAWIAELYGDFFEINKLKDWADLDVIQVAQWSLEPALAGIQIATALSDLENQDTITFSQLQAAWVAAESRAIEYARSYAYDPHKPTVRYA